MGTIFRSSYGGPAGCIFRSLIMIALAASALSTARGQSSVPPLPALPMTFVFSTCEADVTFQATIIDWVRDARGNVDPLATNKVVQGTTVTYSYLFWGSFSLTNGRTTQTATGARLPDGSTSRPIGSLGIMYTNLGIQDVPAATTFLLQSSNANGLGVGTGAATARLAWMASFYGVGNLMPNGIVSPLPPISAWAPTNTFIQGDGQLLARPITGYSACSAAGPPQTAGKGLGDSSNTPGD